MAYSKMEDVFDETHPKMKMKKIASEDHEALDMISYLPKEIIHKIMLSLSTLDSTRMSVLSKIFRSLFRSFPVLDLDFDYSFRSRPLLHTQNWATELLEFVQNSLRSRDSGRDTLDRLIFRAREYWPSNRSINDRSRIETAVQLLVNFALSNGAKELVLDFSEKTVPDLPQALFGSRSIKTMKFSGLSLIDSVVFECPSLEYLALVQCCCLGNELIRLASPRLKTVKIRDCVEIKNIKIDTATTAHCLESFSFKKRRIFHNGDHHDYDSCEITGLGSCSALKHLELEGLGLSDNRWFTADVSIYAGLEALSLIDCNAVTRVSGRSRCLKTLELLGCTAVERIDVVAPNLRDLRLSYLSVTAFPGQFLGFELLESLVLERCNGIEEIVLSSNSLRRLEITSCTKLSMIEINAPNLICFDYTGGVFLRPILISANVHASLRFNSVDHYNVDRKVFSEFISHLGHSKTLTLGCNSSEMLLFPWHIRDSLVSPLYDLQHLSIRLAKNDILYFTEFVDSFLWLAPHPKTISIALGSDHNLKFEFYYKAGYELHEEDKDDELCCCFSKAIKCWRHHLARVDLEAFQGFRDESNLRSYFMTNAKVTLTLK